MSNDEPGLVWERQPGSGTAPTRVALSTDAIVTTAIRIADADGIEAATVRRIAAELGAAPMALYRHVARKEDLPDLMLDAVLGEVELLAEPSGDWRADLRTLAGRRRVALIAHPWLAGVLGAHPPLGPNALGYLECCLSVLAPLDLPVATVQAINGAVDTYVTGFVLREMAELALLRRAGVGRFDAISGVRPYLERAVASGRYPNLARLLTAGAAAGGGNGGDGGATARPGAGAREGRGRDDEEDAFIGILDCLLDGLEARLITPAR